MFRAILITIALATPALAIAQDTIEYTDDLGRTVAIPAAPERVATLDDLRLTVPLLELGVMPVASHGRAGDSGPYIRAAKLVTGTDFDNSSITFLGNDIDVEALAGAAPDLIIAYGSRAEQLAQFEMIAPTVVLDPQADDFMGVYEDLAALVGRQAELDRLQTRYEAQIAQFRALVDTDDIVVSVVSAADGTVTVPHTYGSLGIMLRDAGFLFPEVVESLDVGTEIKLSAERIQDIDADLIIDSYRSDRGEGPADAEARMRDVLEGYCEALWACSNGQYVILPREEFYAISYHGLTASVYTMLALVSGREIETREAR